MCESHVGLSAAIQNCGFIALVVVKDRCILWANEAMHRLFGYDPGELIGSETRLMFVDDASFDDFGRRLGAAIAADRRFCGECRQRRKDGSSGWFEFSVSRLEEYPETLVAVVVDRSSQRQAVEKLSAEAGILSGMRDCVVVTTRDHIGEGIILYANTAFEAAFGYAPGELVGQHVSVLNAATDQSPGAVAAMIIDKLKDDGEWQGDVLCRRKDDSCFWNHVKVSTHCTEAWGKVSISVLRDISDLRATEAALRASEKRHRALVESSSVITWVRPLSGMQETPQPAWMRFTGQSAEEMLGFGWKAAEHPDDRVALDEVVSHEFIKGVAFSYERRLRRYDGEWRWMRVRVVPSRNAAGQVVEWNGMEQDITERKQVEQALKENEERLDTALAASGLALWDWDIPNRRLFGDRRWLSLIGYSMEDTGFHDEEWEAVIHRDDLGAFREQVSAHLAGETPLFYAEYRLRHRDNHWITVEAKGRVTRRDKAGRPLRMVGTIADITQRKRLNSEGVELLKRIEMLIRGAAAESEHDGGLDKEMLRLTRRQREILVMIASGLTSTEIGKRLHLATPTVVSHRRNLMGKLGLHSTADVTRYAMTHGLLKKS